MMISTRHKNFNFEKKQKLHVCQYIRSSNIFTLAHSELGPMPDIISDTVWCIQLVFFQCSYHVAPFTCVYNTGMMTVIKRAQSRQFCDGSEDRDGSPKRVGRWLPLQIYRFVVEYLRTRPSTKNCKTKLIQWIPLWNVFEVTES